MRLPANTPIGKVFEWDISERVTRENPDVINAHFGLANLIPSLAFAASMGITALQCAQSLAPGQTISPNPAALLQQELSADSYQILPRLAPVTTSGNATMPQPVTDIYSLLPPLEMKDDTSSKFGPDAVNINESDDITPDQIRQLRCVISEFPSLWEDRIGRVIEPEDD